MQSIKKSILNRVRVQPSLRSWTIVQNENVLSRRCSRMLCTAAADSSGEVMDRVIGLVKKFDKTEAAKVTETANFQKDLCLDSLDRTELVMAFEQEFSIEIPDEEADKLTCCADVTKYILTESKNRASQNS